MSDLNVPAPQELPLTVLLRLARREVEHDDGDVPMPALSALHRRPSREVFDRAAALVCDSDATQRELGVRILRELRARTEAVEIRRCRIVGSAGLACTAFSVSTRPSP